MRKGARRVVASAKSATFLVLPTQLFSDLSLVRRTAQRIVLLEHPYYFGNSNIRPNRAKVAYLRACMSYYQSYLAKEAPEQELQVVAFRDLTEKDVNAVVDGAAAGAQEVHCYDPIDHGMSETLRTAFGSRLVVHESPALLLSKDQLSAYHKAHPYRSTHATFYEFSKRYLGDAVDVLRGVPNLDKENRIQASRIPPPRSRPFPKATKAEEAHYRVGIDFAQGPAFALHCGDPEGCRHYPITHAGALAATADFLTHHLAVFGPSQDVIFEKELFMNHSVISPMLNNGLLDPRDVLRLTSDAVRDGEKAGNPIPKACYEGFLRQVIGWREYMRYLYSFKRETLLESNAPGNHKTFKDWAPWYKGTTGLVPFDKEVHKALTCGYSHHIVRLMLFLNLFTLLGIHPSLIVKWFMEVVAIDAYDWVMVSNIYAMGYYYPAAMTKPYLSASSYLRRMTNYPKDGKWDTLWDGLFYVNVTTKPNAFVGAYARNRAAADRGAAVQAMSVANKYIADHTVALTTTTTNTPKKRK